MKCNYIDIQFLAHNKYSTKTNIDIYNTSKLLCFQNYISKQIACKHDNENALGVILIIN
jgi:hypothetical protein